MRHRVAALVAAFLVVGAIAVPTSPPTRAATEADPKVVIVVGPTHSVTDTYRQRADVAAAEAAKYTRNVVKIYSPNATWAAVKTALQGASVVLYLGHGNGFPSPYRTTAWPYSQNGFGLNAEAGKGDYNTKYYGEAYVGAEVRLAPNAVVVLNHLCYAAGSSEPGDPEPTVSVAHQRIDNYGAGFIKAGARAVIAEAHIGADWWMRTLFTTRQTIEQAWRDASYGNGNVVSWPSGRSTGYTSYSDPTTPTTGFYRSLVVRPGVTTTDATGAAFADTGADPSDFFVPGAASVGSDDAGVYDDPTVGYVPPTPSPSPSGSPAPSASPGDTTGSASAASPIATLPLDKRLRIVGEADALPDGTRVFEVETFDDSVHGYMAASDLVPRDSYSPAISGLSVSGAVFSPNGDGIEDAFRVAGGFTEDVSWVARIRDADKNVVREVRGSGRTFALPWDGSDGKTALPDGLYTWSVSGRDDWGNDPASQSGTVERFARLVTEPKLGYVPLEPVRLLDTRTGNGLKGPLATRSPRSVQIAGRGGIPANATAVTVNVTVAGQTSGGYVSITPTATATPTTSTINFPVGDIRANGVTVPLGPDGKLSAVFVGALGASTHLILDVTGYSR